MIFLIFEKSSKLAFSTVFDPSRCENRVQHLKIIQNDLFKP